MLVRFLGTSAGELYPGLWCRCWNCQSARMGYPEEMRQSAALYVVPSAPAGATDAEAAACAVLIDFPSEIASQAFRHQVALPDLQHLLVTHSHGDHWFPYLLRWRSRSAALCGPGEIAPRELGAPRFTDLPMLHIWGNAAVEAVLRRELGDNLEPFAVAYHAVRPGDTFTTGAMAVTALHANHDVGREEALHYVLQDTEKTLLYGLDGDTFLPETREALQNFRFDMVILESTYGFGDGRNHRNFARVLEEVAWFRAEARMTAEGRIVATHFSPHHCPPHSETDAYLRLQAIEAAWDGMEIEL